MQSPVISTSQARWSLRPLRSPAGLAEANARPRWRRRGAWRRHSVEATAAEESTPAGAAAAAAHRRPKLQPFNPQVNKCSDALSIPICLLPRTAPPRSAAPPAAQSLAQQRALGFRRAIPCGGGRVLLVEPVAEGAIPASADILTEAFAESMGYISIYRCIGRAPGVAPQAV